MMTPRHGHAKRNGPTSTYLVWTRMRERCFSPKNKRYGHYGGRGITICKRWDSFENFLADMGEKPDGMTLDRINNDGNYEPTNCRWATAAQQNRNSIRNRFIEYQGERLCITDWAARLGISRPTLAERLRRWPLERALSSQRGRPAEG